MIFYYIDFVKVFYYNVKISIEPKGQWVLLYLIQLTVSYIKRLFVGLYLCLCVCLCVTNFLNCYKMANNGWILEFKVSKLPYQRAQ